MLSRSRKLLLCPSNIETKRLHFYEIAGREAALQKKPGTDHGKGNGGGFPFLH